MPYSGPRLWGALCISIKLYFMTIIDWLRNAFRRQQVPTLGAQPANGYWCCADCGGNTWREYFMLKDALWRSFAPRDIRLCVACCEARLGRELRKADFIDAPINRPAFRDKTQRLLTRLQNG